jgi:hypothetical protein
MLDCTQGKECARWALATGKFWVVSDEENTNKRLSLLTNSDYLSSTSASIDKFSNCFFISPGVWLSRHRVVAAVCK